MVIAAFIIAGILALWLAPTNDLITPAEGFLDPFTMALTVFVTLGILLISERIKGKGDK